MNTPMSARDEILARVRSAVAGAAAVGQVPRAAYADASVPDVAALFVERVEDYRAEVTRVAPADLAAAVAAALAGVERVVVPAGVPSEWLAAVPAEVVPDDDLSAADLDAVGAVVTGAAVGIAVTGTIVLDHGPDQGRRALSLVPDVHVCVVRESQLVADVGAGVARLADAVAAGRPLTWISGPSATSDIELERVEGVHGPRTLRVLLLAD